ncbi:MAG TPA: phosphate acetyltransferase, partial [Terrimesophilobacter sp.]|nr:phosphate acetyltransferase [Terrimesophilobacter sp.]
MARSIYIASIEGHSGKSTIALGVLDALSHRVGRVGVFRPVARSIQERDYVLDMLLAAGTGELGYDDCVGVTYDDVHANPEAALSRIVERYNAVERASDAVVIVGSDYTDVASPTELSFNARIAANLGAPVLLVLTGRDVEKAGGRSADQLRQIAEITVPELAAAHAGVLAVVVNRADPTRLDDITRSVSAAAGVPAWSIPEDRVLVAPTVGTIMAACDGRLIKGDPALLQREALSVVIAGMSMENVLTRLDDGAIVVVAGDRSEVLLALLMANASGTFPSLAGVVLNGGFPISATIEKLITGLDPALPIISTELETFDTAQRISQSRGRLAADSQRKHDTALALFERHVDAPALLDRLEVGHSDVVTPLMFEFGLIERARSNIQHIVLPEGDDDRVLRAASTLLGRGVAKLTILGEEQEVRTRAAELGLDISAATVLSTRDPELRERFANEYLRLRAHKGITIDAARDTVTDVSYFGTLMVHLGLADGMVSGAAHTTAHTIRPGFEIIKTRPGVSIVSSVFFMALEDRVLVYGDCAVVPDPTAEQLADIAVSSAATAEQFGVAPRLAMLSYSTGESGTGAGVDKVRAATALVRSRRPDLAVDGPIQYDAAADAAVAAAKLPNSEVAGRATVFIFPD